jgi:hypothetical protein
MSRLEFILRLLIIALSALIELVRYRGWHG